MKYFALLLVLVSFSSLACWKMEGSLGVDGETWKLHQKVDHDKDYSFPMGTFILNIKVVQGKKKSHTVQYSVWEKKGSKMVLVTKGSEDLEEEKSKDIYAKGEPQQPNSIITLKLNHI
jgi:hypothetical protein